MKVSEARKAANQANGARGNGPVSARGKEISRRNSTKHGLTGAGIVLLEGDQAEVERRVEDLHEELQPKSAVGSMLIRKIAINSVRSERAAERENAAIAQRVRVAVHAHDEERSRHVDSLCEALRDDPRAALRNLRRMPEGVDRLLESWRVLRRCLDLEGPPNWASREMARAANLIGMPHLDVHDTRIGDLSSAIWGDFRALRKHEGGDLDDEARREWARAELIVLIDGQITELETHRTTLDFDRIEQDRREAPARCTFDDSKEASLARRYEADADRSFYKALKEFRQVEAEAATRIEQAPEPPNSPRPDPRMGSFCETTPTADRERSLAFLDDPALENSVVRGSDGRPLSITRPLPPPA